ncbi:MAG: NAD(P)H-dependent oxidoreductase subunit E [Dehalococcoidia bacterium]
MTMVSKADSRRAARVPGTVQKVVRQYDNNRDMLIQILLDLQGMFGWLSWEVLTEVSEKLEIPFARVCHIASFYKAFSLAPRGRHTIKVCMGTACQVRGAPQLANVVSAMLDMKTGETSPDMRFTLETVNCLGCCAMGPVIAVDGAYHSKPSTADLERIIKSAK